MSVGVEVPLTADEIEALRVMLQAPGYQALVKLEDGFIAALDAAPVLMGKMDSHDPDIPKAFMRANVAREFRDVIHGEVMRIVNAARTHQASEGVESQESPFAAALRPEHPGFPTPANPAGTPEYVQAIRTKYRR